MDAWTLSAERRAASGKVQICMRTAQPENIPRHIDGRYSRRGPTICSSATPPSSVLLVRLLVRQPPPSLSRLPNRNDTSRLPLPPAYLLLSSDYPFHPPASIQPSLGCYLPRCAPGSFISCHPRSPSSGSPASEWIAMPLQTIIRNGSRSSNPCSPPSSRSCRTSQNQP